MSPVYIVSFSGHRTENQPGRSSGELENCRSLIHAALVDFRDRAQAVGGTIHLATSAAEGADLIACQIAIAEKIPIHLVLPLNPDQFKEDFSEPNRMHTWDEVQNIISHAQSPDNNSTFRIAHTSHLRPDCYHETNLQLLESTDALIVVWNGQDSTSNAGTKAAWDTAKKLALPRIHLNPLSLKRTDFQLEKFALKDGPGLQIIHDLLPDSAPVSCNLIETLGKELDAKANKSSKDTRSQTRTTIILHGLASFLAAGGISYALAGGSDPLKVLPIIALIELIFIGAAELIHFRLHHNGKDWIQSRFAAELLRPLHLVLPHLDPLRPLIRNHQPAWHRFLLTIGLAQPCKKITDLEEAKADYLTGRIEDQIDHFSKKHDQARPWANWLFWLMRGAAWGALLVVLGSVIIKFSHYNETHIGFNTPFKIKEFTLYLLPVALPLLAGILLSYRRSFDLGRRNLRYPEMITNLQRAKIDLENVQTPQALRQVITRTEEILLDELNEFHTSQRIGLEH